MTLQVRLTLEMFKGGRASRRDALVLTHTVLFTRFLTEAGHGRLELALVQEVESELLVLLEEGESVLPQHIERVTFGALTKVVNEHDRQLREVRFTAIVDATERLQRQIAAKPSQLSLRGSA